MIARCHRLAMGTRFVALLVGDDEVHLMAVGEAALDEVGRIERLLSRHDPASETSRINREAGSRPVLVSPELFALLGDCLTWSAKTGGYFDPCASPGGGSPGFTRTIRLDEASRTVRLLHADTRLDFGGIGKGYALDSAARVLDEFGVRSAVIHGGTSSVLARGRLDDASSWRVGLRDPFDPGGVAEVEQVELTDGALSSSAAFGTGSGESDVIDPIGAAPLVRQSACTVLAPTATEAEVLSTALLAMGGRRAAGFLRRGAFPGCRAAWIGRRGGRVEVEWLAEGGEGLR